MNNNLQKNFNKKNQKGFTLIELLVVISIIGVLASIVLSSIQNARLLARDAQRISDIRQMRIALELYRNDNGTYPKIGYWVNSSNSSWSSLQTALSKYMPTLPKDPKNNAAGPWTTGNYSYSYGYDPDSYTTANGYDLVAQLENTSSTQIARVKLWPRHVDGTSWYPSYSPYLYTGDY